MTVRQPRREWWKHRWQVAVVTASAILFLLVAVLNGMMATALGLGHPTIALLALTPAPAVFAFLFARKWRARITIPCAVYLAASVLITAANWGVGWVVSDVLREGGLEQEDPVDVYDLEVVSVGPGTVTLKTTSLTGDDSPWRADGIWGLESESGGYYTTSGIVLDTSTQVERTLSSPPAGLAAGDRVRMDDWAFRGDPQTALGIPFQQVTYTSPLGAFPAWFIDGPEDTWVVFVHGMGSERGQGLRVLRTTHELGLPTLIITYRNDIGVPSPPDGYYRYGETEWEDLEGAVDYAIESGARRVVLVGYSMGGGIVASFLHRSPSSYYVAAAVLDAPMLDFGSTVDFGGERRGYPKLIITIGKAVSRHRLGVHWTDLNYIRHAGELDAPVLLIHGGADERVPIEPSEALARLRPDIVTFLRFEGAAHNAAWNADPRGYDQSLREFLERVLE